CAISPWSMSRAYCKRSLTAGPGSSHRTTSGLVFLLAASATLKSLADPGILVGDRYSDTAAAQASDRRQSSPAIPRGHEELTPARLSVLGTTNNGARPRQRIGRHRPLLRASRVDARHGSQAVFLPRQARPRTRCDIQRPPPPSIVRGSRPRSERRSARPDNRADVR